jgi:phosphate transport system ATP-binding protein
MEKENAVIVNNFSFWYGAFKALNHVSLDVPTNEITALIGPSGCGKSTLLKCMNRINENQGIVSHQGAITIFGHDIYHPLASLPEIRRQVGMVFQKPNPLPLSIYENIVFGLKTHYSRRELSKSMLDEKVEQSLKEVGMWDEVKDRLKQIATSLSLEKQQKLCIARLLPLKPKLILLDEPCSALDPQGTKAIEDLIQSLKKQYSILMVTHSMAQARRSSDRTIFMFMGEVVEAGRTEQIFSNAKEIRTTHYIEGRFG